MRQNRAADLVLPQDQGTLLNLDSRFFLVDVRVTRINRPYRGDLL